MEDNQNNNRNFFSGHKGRNKNIMIIVAMIGGIGAIVLAFSTVMENSSAVSNILTHNHINLNVTIGGKPIIVPANIGVIQTGIFADPLLYADHSLDKYGMEGMSPLHTHDSSGVIHVESSTVRNYTLGEFLSIWRGLDVDGKPVKASVNDKPVSDFRNIILNDGEKIKLDIVS